MHIFLYAGRISPSRTIRRSTAQENDRKKTLEDGTKSKQWYYEARVSSLCRGWDSKFSRVLVPVMWPSHPEACVEARKRVETRVGKVLNSIDRFGVQVTKVVLLVWLEDLEEASLTIDQLDFTLKNPPVPFHTIAGDHTSAAIQRKHAARPLDPAFQTIPVEILCCKKTNANVFLAHLFGELDNLVDELAEGATAWSIVVSCHSAKELIDRDPLLSAKDKKLLLKDKLDRMARLHSEKYAAATFGSLRALAMRNGELWDVIHQIFDGANLPTAKGARNKGAPGLGHFNGMSAIPENELIKWAKNVKHGTWSTKQFSDRCEHFKKVVKVTTQMVDYVNSLCPAGHSGYEDFDAVRTAYPIFSNDEWFTQLVSWCEKEQKKPLNIYAKNAIQQAITAQQQQDVAAQSQSSSSSSSSSLSMSQVHFLWCIAVSAMSNFFFS